MYMLSLLQKVKIDVAIKTLRDASVSSNKESLLLEAKVMCKLKHENIVELIGICEKPELMIVSHYFYSARQTYRQIKMWTCRKMGTQNDRSKAKLQTHRQTDKCRHMDKHTD